MHSTDPDFGPARTTDPAVSAASQPVLRRQRRDVTHGFEALVQLAPDATVVVDAKGRIRLVNHQTEELFGYPAEELLGQPVELLVPERLRAVHQHHRADYTGAPHLRPMSSSLPLSGRRRDESEFPLEASLGPLDEGGESLVIISIRDITERKRLEREREEARAEAEQQAAQLTGIFEAMADGVVVFDAQGHIVRENAAQQRLEGTGTAPPHFAELPLPERMALFAARDEHGRPLGPDEGPLPRALRGEVVSGAETMDLRSRTLDGREVELNVSAAPLRDQDGHLTGAVAIFRDQTERKRLERERTEQAEQLDRIFEGIADGVGVYDTHARLVRLNAAARRILGFDPVPADYAQQPLSDRVSLFEARNEQDRPVALEDWPLMRVLSGQATGADIREIRMRTLDGRDVELSISVAPLRDEVGRITGAVGIFHDQTEQKRLAREEERARAHEMALEDTARHMDEFLATASHDLRTPLTVVKSRVQIALRRLRRLWDSAAAPPDALPETDLAALHASLLEANQSADQLTRLVAMLFDVSLARSGTLELRLAPCDLAALVRKNVTAQQTAVPERRINLEVPEALVPVEADADRLDQVLSNYLTNALKYSSADQPVTVKLVVVENQAVVSVADHGPGLPPEEQTRIWEVFHRAPGIEVQSGNTEVSGSLGLGLHICKQLIELHPGGSVGVESVVGEGSTFWFRLPLTS